jgi:hypothetical protein
MELRCAFRRNTAAETMTAVRKQDPPELVDPARPISPALERRMVRRCFERTAAQRCQSPNPLLFAHSTPAHACIPWMQWTATAFARMAVVARTWFLASGSSPTTLLPFAIPLSGQVSHMSRSADGSMLAFVSPDEQIFGNRYVQPENVTPRMIVYGRPWWRTENSRRLEVSLPTGTAWELR